MYWPLIAIVLSVPPATPPHVQARATVRVLNSVQVSKEAWTQSSRRMERVVRESDGRWILLRTLDFE